MFRRIFNLLAHPWRIPSKIMAHFRNPLVVRIKACFELDAERFLMHAGFRSRSKSYDEALIVVGYHAVEKGLTMPNRRLSFGHDNLRALMANIRAFKSKYGNLTVQVSHGVSVIAEYWHLHKSFDMSKDVEYWHAIESFVSEFGDGSYEAQTRVTSGAFYAKKTAAFPDFARARHTLRQYTGTISEAEICAAVELAQTAPSACNRQPVRIFCVEGKGKDEILRFQSGNRGFGPAGDKLLIVTGELGTICWPEERHDVYTNCGIFLMNLSYALFYSEIAHCILNWSIATDPSQEAMVREIAKIPDSQIIAAMVICGKAPDEVDVAASPRKPVAEILTFVHDN